ncbi:MAG: peptidoglycan DD-metalloendopeptidase family protein [Kofleriaceae bacterium]
MTDAERLVVELGYDGPDLRRRSFVPVFAVQDGTIAHVEETGGGSAITLDHGRWFTHYSVLEHVFVTKRGHATGRRERVRAGDILGYLRWPGHLRFELWQFDADDEQLVPVDPEPHLQGWLMLPDLEQPSRTRAIAA